MARGDKDYFRHSFHTRNDDKIREFQRLLGRDWRSAYFYYFTLIELCASQAEKGQEEFKIHLSTLREMWGTNAKGVASLCKLCGESELLGVKHCDSFVVFSIPKLSKYMGFYSNKNQDKQPNKRKEKERKENTNSEPVKDAFKDQIYSIVNYLNEKTGKSYKTTTPTTESKLRTILKTYNTIDIKRVIDQKCSEWKGTEYEKFLRPETLFGNKFEGYSQEKVNGFNKFLNELSEVNDGQ